MKYNVLYLVRAKRAPDERNPMDLDKATQLLKSYKRLGFTAWIENEIGTFVPVPGCRRKPGELK